MINFKIKFTPEAAKFISKLHPENKKTIKAAIKEIIKRPYLGDELQGELSGFKSYKPKNYRILYKIDEQKESIHIYFIGQRKDVYQQFSILLKKLTSND